MNHRRKKKKPKQIRKAVQIKPIVEEKPLKKSSKKLVDILLGILLFQFYMGCLGRFYNTSKQREDFPYYRFLSLNCNRAIYDRKQIRGVQMFKKKEKNIYVRLVNTQGKSFESLIVQKKTCEK